MVKQVEAWADEWTTQVHGSKGEADASAREAATEYLSGVPAGDMRACIRKQHTQALKFRLALSVLAEWIAEVDRPPLPPGVSVDRSTGMDAAFSRRTVADVLAEDEPQGGRPGP